MSDVQDSQPLERDGRDANQPSARRRRKPDSSRVVKRNSRLFLSKHKCGRRVSIHLDQGYCGWLGAGPGELVGVRLIQEAHEYVLVIRKVTQRGGTFVAKPDGWGTISVQFDEELIRILFGAGVSHHIPTDVRTTEVGQVMIALVDVQLETRSETLGSDVCGPSLCATGALENPGGDPTHPDPGRARRSPASGYYGVEKAGRSGRFRTKIRCRNRTVWMGGYSSPHEAAYALNHAERLLFGEDARILEIRPGNVPIPARQGTIVATVELRLRQAGVLDGPVRDRSRISETSAYRGASWHAHSERWQAKIYLRDKLLCLGYYDSEHLAALAYNVASEILYPGENMLNTVPAGKLPPDLDEADLRAAIAAKIEGHGIQPPDRLSS